MDSMEVYLENKKRICKPSSQEIGQINNTITKLLVDKKASEIFNSLINGSSILPNIMSGKRSIQNFKKTKLIFLDFDNSEKVNGKIYKYKGEYYIPYQKMLNNKFVQDHALFMYVTFSSSKKIEKYRIVFELSEYVTSKEKLIRIYKNLLSIFPTADKACLDVSRMFFGGHSGDFISDKNYIDVKEFSNEIKKESFTNIPLEDIPISDGKLNENSKQLSLSNTEIVRKSLDIAENTNNIIKFIKKKNKKQLAHYYGSHYLALDTTVHSYEEAMDKILSINLFDLLGLDKNINPFCCILSNDRNPSASIFETELDGKPVYLYNRFSNQDKLKNLNAIAVFSKLTKLSYLDTIQFLCKVLNITVEFPNEIKEIQKQIKQTIKVLSNKNFESRYQNFYKIAKIRIAEIKGILTILHDSIHIINKQYRVLSWYSLGTYVEKIYGENTKENRKKLEKVINVLTYLKIIQKVPISTLGTDIKNSILQFTKENNYKRYINIIEIKNVDNYFETIESRAKKLIENKFSYNRFNNTYLTYLFSNEEQKQVFIQDKASDKKLIAFKKDIQDFLLHNLDKEKKPFIFESEVKNDLKRKYSKKFLENYYTIVIVEILELFSLTRHRLSNNNIIEFGLNDITNRPNIIHFI